MLVPLAVVGLASVFAYRQRVDIAAAMRVMGNADTTFIVLGIALQLAVILLITLSYRPILRRMRHDLPFARLLAVQLQRQVVSMVTPIGYAGSACAFVRGLNRNGVVVDDSVLTLSVRGVASGAAYIVPLGVFLAWQRPAGAMLFITGTLIAYHALKTGLILLFLRQRRDARRTSRTPRRLRCFVDRARRHGIGPTDMVVPGGLALAAHLANVLALAAWLRAVGQPTSLGVPLAALVAGVVTAYAAPFFHGIGVVEVSMVTALQGCGVPAEAAIGATLLYRVSDFGLPLLLCGISQLAGLPGPRRFVRAGATIARGALAAVAPPLDGLRSSPRFTPLACVATIPPVLILLQVGLNVDLLSVALELVEIG
jgi:uncharacterized membrane protein YbhN (UPF0104 family)